MFSGDVQVTLSNGSKKSIKDVTKYDIVLNKMYKPVKVKKLNVYTVNQSIEIELDNETDPFHASENTLMYCRYINAQGIHISEFCPLKNVQLFHGNLKSTIRNFSPESDVHIVNYNVVDGEQILYSIETMDTMRSYIANGIVIGY
jgi:hypothetical protein